MERRQLIKVKENRVIKMLFTMYDIDRWISGSLLFQESCLEFMNFAEGYEESKRGDKADGLPREAQKKQWFV